MKCPKCKLINPEDALRCDCGYDFPTGTVQQSYLEPKRPQPSEAPSARPAEQIWCAEF